MDSPEVHLLALLDAIAIAKRPCRHCGALLYFVRLKNGNLTAYNSDGVNDHVSGCPRGRQAVQQALLETHRLDPQ